MKRHMLAGMLAVLLLFTSCGGNAAQQGSNALLSGYLTLGGSTSAEGIANSLLEAFMFDTAIAATYTARNSLEGYESVEHGNLDMAFASYLPPYNTLSSILFARERICVIVHPENPVTNISSEQLRAVYDGELTNWAQLGGADAEIVLLGRLPGSGTRATLEESLGLVGTPAYHAVYDGSGALANAVSSTPHALGYVSHLAHDGSGTVALSIDGAYGSEDELRSGQYPLLQSFYLLYDAQDREDDIISAFLGFIRGANIRELIQASVVVDIHSD